MAVLVISDVNATGAGEGTVPNYKHYDNGRSLRVYRIEASPIVHDDRLVTDGRQPVECAWEEDAGGSKLNSFHVLPPDSANRDIVFRGTTDGGYLYVWY